MMHGQKRVKLGRNKSLKRELSNDTTFDPPNFSLDSSFNGVENEKWPILVLKITTLHKDYYKNQEVEVCKDIKLDPCCTYVL